MRRSCKCQRNCFGSKPASELSQLAETNPTIVITRNESKESWYKILGISFPKRTRIPPTSSAAITAHAITRASVPSTPKSFPIIPTTISGPMTKSFIIPKAVKKTPTPIRTSPRAVPVQPVLQHDFPNIKKGKRKNHLSA